MKTLVTHIRRLKAMSTLQLAKKTGLSHQAIVKIERLGRTKPATAIKIARALNVSPFELFPSVWPNRQALDRLWRGYGPDFPGVRLARHLAGELAAQGIRAGRKRRGPNRPKPALGSRRKKNA